ncbi:hypothetical protein E2C01_093143 [Portunus trituberculatus]|uniref:Uncharacterized protein n=1 Tax=Portunus trituberculatus TaxID=210409 RepID=A0A5B7JXU5_PORTR|nr:hypothetical protein [Portunus trituberculatus]
MGAGHTLCLEAKKRNGMTLLYSSIASRPALLRQAMNDAIVYSGALRNLPIAFGARFGTHPR